MKILVRGFEGELGMSICRAAGLDPSYVRRIVIDLDVGDVGKVYIEMFADEALLNVSIPSDHIEVEGA